MDGHGMETTMKVRGLTLSDVSLERSSGQDHDIFVGNERSPRMADRRGDCTRGSASGDKFGALASAAGACQTLNMSALGWLRWSRPVVALRLLGRPIL